MKLTKALVAGGASFRAISFGRDQDTATGPDFKKLELDTPLNWVAGASLFPGNVIAGFNSELSQYDAQGWADYVLDQCKQYSACTSTVSYQATNSGSTGGRFWFGYVFRGGPTTAEDYVRETGVEDSIVFTIVDEDVFQVQGTDL
ncbi:hypothetical protein SLS62_003202 [Diatrype stigma]|uniref:Uncharacterized protein n=1 Tax=Diatrype stigma TaxID=117547 RepID=A0AAN9UVD3_9PEZI